MYRELNQHHSKKRCLLLIWISNYSHYTRRENMLFHPITGNEPRTLFMISYCLLVSHSFFQISVTQWDFHQPVPLSCILPLSPWFFLARSLCASRCQVQWESLCCWMSSDTFQNNDNKLQARPSAIHPWSSHCTRWPQPTTNSRNKRTSTSHTLLKYSSNCQTKSCTIHKTTTYHIYRHCMNYGIMEQQIDHSHHGKCPIKQNTYLPMNV